eukprot:4672525-Pyramimonas_sp.AAC.1
MGGCGQAGPAYHASARLRGQDSRPAHNLPGRLERRATRWSGGPHHRARRLSLPMLVQTAQGGSSGQVGPAATPSE